MEDKTLQPGVESTEDTAPGETHRQDPQMNTPLQCDAQPSQIPLSASQPAQYPQYPPQPTQAPLYAAQPVQYPQYPPQPTQVPPYAAQPVQYPQYPPQPTQAPQYAAQPVQYPQCPPQPTQVPLYAAQPAQYPQYPSHPMQYPYGSWLAQQYISPEEQARRAHRRYVSEVRRRSNAASGFSMLYIGILSECVMAVMIIAVVIKMIAAPEFLHDFDAAWFSEMIMDMATDGLGYLIAMPLLFLMLFLWKKKRFFKNVLFAKKQSMSVSTFFLLFSLIFLIQLASDGFSRLIELLLNQFGFSALKVLESMEYDSSVTMFLYAGILGPIMEELMFRGGVLRSLQPYGRRFAVLMSAFLFGMMHGNLIQIPFAFAVGLLFGYAAVEYSIWWCIGLHIFNNLVLAEIIPFLCKPLSDTGSMFVQYGILVLGSIAAIVLCIVKRKEIKNCLRSDSIRKGTVKGFFTSPMTIIFCVFIMVNVIFTIGAL